MQNLKYKILTDQRQIITVDGEPTTVYRIQALRTFTNTATQLVIKEGELGGYVEINANLSQDGSCWIFNGAIVCGLSLVDGDAAVLGNIRLTGQGIVTGASVLDGDVEINTATMIAGRSYLRKVRIDKGAKVELRDCALSNVQIEPHLSVLMEGVALINPYESTPAVIKYNQDVMYFTNVTNACHQMVVYRNSLGQIRVQVGELRCPRGGFFIGSDTELLRSLENRIDAWGSDADVKEVLGLFKVAKAKLKNSLGYKRMSKRTSLKKHLELRSAQG